MIHLLCLILAFCELACWSLLNSTWDFGDFKYFPQCLCPILVFLARSLILSCHIHKCIFTSKQHLLKHVFLWSARLIYAIVQRLSPEVHYLDQCVWLIPHWETCTKSEWRLCRDKILGGRIMLCRETSSTSAHDTAPSWPNRPVVLAKEMHYLGRHNLNENWTCKYHWSFKIKKDKRYRIHANRSYVQRSMDWWIELCSYHIFYNSRFSNSRTNTTAAQTEFHPGWSRVSAATTKQIRWALTANYTGGLQWKGCHLNFA